MKQYHNVINGSCIDCMGIEETHKGLVMFTYSLLSMPTFFDQQIYVPILEKFSKNKLKIRCKEFKNFLFSCPRSTQILSPFL